MQMAGSHCCPLIVVLFVCSLVEICAAAVQSTHCNSELVYLREQRCCNKCPPGTYMEKDCTASTDSVCKPCQSGSYFSTWNSHFNCFLCKDCTAEDKKFTRRCTNISDSECACSDGFRCGDTDCKTCVKKETPCEKRTYSYSGFQPCIPWTNCTASGRSEMTPGNGTNDVMCISLPQVPPFGWSQAQLTAMLVALGCVLFTLFVVLHIIIWRRNNRKKFVLLAAEASGPHLRRQTEDTCSSHFPEQECAEEQTKSI